MERVDEIIQQDEQAITYQIKRDISLQELGAVYNGFDETVKPLIVDIIIEEAKKSTESEDELRLFLQTLNIEA